MIVVLLTWLLLGIHSVWFFVKRFTQHHDLTTNEIWMVLSCLFFPIITHFATIYTFPNIKKPIVIKKKVK